MKSKHRQAMRDKATRQYEMAADTLKWFDDNRQRLDSQKQEQAIHEYGKTTESKNEPF
jgi:hypothetical protein